MSLSETISPARAAGGGMVPTRPVEPSSRSRGRTAIGALFALAMAGVFGLLFAGCFRELYFVWNTNDNYSHGFLVPAVSLWIAWEVLRRQGLTGEGATIPGLFWILLGCALHLWANLN